VPGVPNATRDVTCTSTGESYLFMRRAPKWDNQALISMCDAPIRQAAMVTQSLTHKSERALGEGQADIDVVRIFH